MDALHEELAAIVASLDAGGVPVVVIGAFAVRAYLSKPDQRLTQDLDLLVRSSDVEPMRRALEKRGYRVYPLGPWWRAERNEPRAMVDFAVGAVVDVSSFQSYALDPAEAIRRAEPGCAMLPVPRIEDVIALKLLAHRDKDLLDLVALFLEPTAVDVPAFVQRVEARDLEIPIRRGYLELIAAAESGELALLWTRRSEEPLDSDALARALARVHDHLSMNRPRYFVDARRSVPFDSLDQAKAFARQNFPAVILERVDGEDGRFAWHEILRFDWRWDEARGEPVITFF